MGGGGGGGEGRGGGGCVDHIKISWVDWTTVCRRKEIRDLGVRRIREFNTALLGKWCWRMLVERESLWFKVLLELRLELKIIV